MFLKSGKIQRNSFLELGCPTTFSARIVEDTGDAFVTFISIRIYVCTMYMLSENNNQIAGEYSQITSDSPTAE